MKQTSINYFDGEQKLIAELIYDEQQTVLQPGIIVFPAFEGRGDFAINYGRDLAQQGYTVLVADMYGDAKVATTIEDCFALITPFLNDRALVRRRAVLAYKALAEQKNIDQNRLGAIGFCFGGMCALEVARSGENIAAVVTAHGVLQKSDLPTHLIKAGILVLHGYKDPQVPPQVLKAFAEEIQEAGVRDWMFTFFGDAKHSFTDPKSGTFDPQKEKEMGREYNAIAAKRSFRLAVDFFNELLL